MEQMRISGNLYFDHQATTPVPNRVLEQMLPYFNEYFGNPHSTDHSFGWKSSLAIENATKQIADLIGAFPDEIYFTSGATESNNLALLGLARKVNSKSRKMRFILSEIEHKCVLEAGRVISQQYELPVNYLPVDQGGRVNLNILEDLLKQEALAVSIMAVNNEIGTIQDIEAIAKIVRKAGAIYHCDAAQAPISMNLQHMAEHVDMLSLSAHKMYGPKGIGILYIRREIKDQLEPIIFGGGQQNGLRSGTIPTPLCVGMGFAAEFFNYGDINQKRKLLFQRRVLFLEKLKKLPWSINLNGIDGKLRHPGNLNLCFEDFIAKDILQLLQPNIAASTGSACNSVITESSHVLKAIGLSNHEVESSIRFSLGFDTTDEDVDLAVNLINEALEKISKFNSKNLNGVN